jgi:hypothetical protein
MRIGRPGAGASTLSRHRHPQYASMAKARQAPVSPTSGWRYVGHSDHRDCGNQSTAWHQIGWPFRQKTGENALTVPIAIFNSTPTPRATNSWPGSMTCDVPRCGVLARRTHPRRRRDAPGCASGSFEKSQPYMLHDLKPGDRCGVIMREGSGSAGIPAHKTSATTPQISTSAESGKRAATAPWLYRDQVRRHLRQMPANAGPARPTPSYASPDGSGIAAAVILGVKPSASAPDKS